MSAPGTQRTPGRLPAEAGIWMFILGDMTVFATFFGVIVYYATQDPATFAASQESLSQGLGAINTVLLLTGSLFVALAVGSARSGRAGTARRLLWGGIAGGVAFAAVKTVEYADKLGAGIDVTTNDFYMCFFLFTGIHLAHVLVGVGALVAMRSSLRSRQAPTGRRLAMFEGGACYWHMVDLVWLVLFPLLYFVS